MLRLIPRLTAGLVAVATLTAPVIAQTPSELSRTAVYVASFQNPDGGFAPKLGGASTLGATSSAVRTLGFDGGSIPDVLAAITYIKSCIDKESGGFAPTPGGKADVQTTAVGLMALNELKIAEPKTVEAALKFLAETARTFDEVRIAVAGFEAARQTSPMSEEWTGLIVKTRNEDGTFGQGEGQARETGGKAVALLRMGVALEKRDAVTSFLKAAQRPDGAWCQKEGVSELETTYRIMRFFFMTKQKPDLDRLASFLAKCRHSDGGYGVQAGADASPQGTYYASIIARWSRILNGEPALVETAGFQPLFNGKDLTGWDGNTTLWSARDGVLVGASPGLKQNEFLATPGSWSDFVLKLTFRMTGSESSNSGVQFRSVRIPGTEMSGYQADVGQNYWGCLYDESRRNKILVPASESAVKAIHKDGWNQYVIDAKADHIRLNLNGVQSVDYHEADPKVARAGRAAVQIHAGGPMTVEFKNILIQSLPTPQADTSVEPGFHLRTLASDKGGRKYAVSIPKGYDGETVFPVILFLHGSGERGEDGVLQTQAGIGPAVFNNMDGFPAVVVYPQAKTTWRADSDDARAALDALDEVLNTLKTDRRRVVLTGLSMGGSGTWDLAATHPERFSAVVPICGRGKTENAAKYASLPVWALCGDADRAETVTNMREMVLALRAAGGEARLTEYREVGHNSWDRAYNDARLIDWMLSQSRK
jgi:poly(3-hydroxybutyrate) depolymerase/prenyltransferase beta subunit